MAVFAVTKRFVHDRFLPVRERWPTVAFCSLVAAGGSQLIAAFHPLDQSTWSYPNEPELKDELLSTAADAGFHVTVKRRHVFRNRIITPFADFKTWRVEMDTGDYDSMYVGTVEAGFPFRSAAFAGAELMRSTTVPSTTLDDHELQYESVQAEDGRVLRSGERLTDLEDAYPIRPRWLGLLGNVVVYVLTFNIAVFVLADARRSLRERRGLCGRCGHRRAVTGPCVECGEIPDHPIIPDLI